LRPAESIHPLTYEVMREVGLSLDGHRPSPIKDHLGAAAVTTVIIVCPRAEAECPTTWPGAVERLSWPLDDPASCHADDPAAPFARFREVRDAIRSKVESWLAGLNRLA